MVWCGVVWCGVVWCGVDDHLVTTYSVRGFKLFSPIAVASSTKRARPKSVIRSLQSFDTKMLPGFKSRSDLV